MAKLNKYQVITTIFFWVYMNKNSKLSIFSSIFLATHKSKTHLEAWTSSSICNIIKSSLVSIKLSRQEIMFIETQSHTPAHLRKDAHNINVEKHESFHLKSIICLNCPGESFHCWNSFNCWLQRSEVRGFFLKQFTVIAFLAAAGKKSASLSFFLLISACAMAPRMTDDGSLCSFKPNISSRKSNIQRRAPPESADGLQSPIRFLPTCTCLTRVYIEKRGEDLKYLLNITAVFIESTPPSFSFMGEASDRRWSRHFA